MHRWTISTHVRLRRRPLSGLLGRWIVGTSLIIAASSSTLLAQTGGARNKAHYLLDSSAPPGQVARAQIAGGRPGVGTFTAISIIGPQGLQVGLAADGQFLAPIPTPVTTGMLVGAVYRFRVTHIPDRPGEELYPSLEIIDRVYPEAGREHRSPIPVVLTDEDLRLALQGAMITRVIYLEDARYAQPIATGPDEQYTIDVGINDNALRAADQLGRPLAILRIGSRVPSDLSGDLSGFLYGCPPWVPLPVAPTAEALIQQGRWPYTAPAPPGQPIYAENATEHYPRTESYR